MKAVLLAAGRSFRMKPIEDKNALQFLGKSLIEHQVNGLRAAGCKEILIIGGAHNLSYLKKILHVGVREQKDLEEGMAGGVLAAASWVKNEPFLLVSGNDVMGLSSRSESRFSKQGGASEGPLKILRQAQDDKVGFLLAKKITSYFPGGYLKVNRAGVISEIVEKPKPGSEPSSLVNLVVHFHPQPKLLFDVLKEVSSTHDDRYERALQGLFQKGLIYRAISYEGFWQPVKYPWHVLSLMDYFLGMISKKGRIGGKKASVAKTATISGDVYLEDGVRVLDNAVIHGPAYIGRNTVIATNALVRQSHIGENCVIGFGSEVARSYLGDNVWMHTNYVGDSVIGNDVSFGAGGVTGNLRLDEGEISVSISKSWNGEVATEKQKTGRNKLGIITGNHIRVGINTGFMPGVKIGSNSCIGPGLTVHQDVPEDSFVTGEAKLNIRKNIFKIKPR